MVTDDGLGHFVVTTGGGEGTDTLSGVEKVSDGAGHNFLLVGNGGYATIYAAMSAAQSGDTIMIAAGTFNIGDGAPPGQDTFGSVGSGHLPDNVTFIGAGEGQTIIIGNPRIASDTADFGTGVANGLTLKNMTLQYSAGNQYILQWDAGNGGHNLTLDNVTLTGTSNGNAGSGNLSAIAGADGLTLNNVTYNVTTTAGGATTFIFGSGNDITVTGGHYSNVGGTTVLNIFDSSHTTVTGATFSGANLFLQNANAAGGARSSVEGNTFEGGGYLRLNQSSHVDVDGNTFTIEGSGQGVRISNNNFGPNAAPSDITVTDNTFTAGATATASAAPLALQAGDQSLPATYPVVTFTGNTVTGLSLETRVTGGTPGEDLTHYGTSGSNLIDGGAGNDTLDGGAGADTMIGGTGNDTFIVDNVGDVVTENLNEGTDTVQSSISYTLGANVENLTLTGSGNINGTGNGDANVVTGNSGNNTLDGRRRRRHAQRRRRQRHLDRRRRHRYRGLRRDGHQFDAHRRRSRPFRRRHRRRRGHRHALRHREDHRRRRSPHPARRQWRLRHHPRRRSTRPWPATPSGSRPAPTASTSTSTRTSPSRAPITGLPATAPAGRKASSPAA